MQDHLMQAFQAGLQAVQPDRAIRQFVELTVDGFKIVDCCYSTVDLRILTVGKAAAAMAETLANLLGDKVQQGLVVSPQAGQKLPTNWRTVLGNHQSLGYQPQIVTTQMTGVASSQGRSIAQAIQAAVPGTALVYGGETTVTLPVDCAGWGGRNQELVLAAAIELQHYSAPVWLGSIGTDGIDGNSPAAGAIIETQTWQMARAKKIMAEEYLDLHDSYHFFEQLGQAIITGATGTNVADLSIALKPN
jgi:glycerate-2-kinase